MATAETELYSLLIPLAGDRLIVPRACVAEVIGYHRPQRPADAPDWYLGTVEWNTRSVPVLSFEAICGRDVPDSGTRTRIVVFYALSGKLASGHFGLLTQGFPQLVRINPGVIGPEPDSRWTSEGPVLCQVRMANERPLVPDLERLEELLADEVI